MSNLLDAFKKITDDTLQEKILYCLTKILLTIPQFEELSRDQESAFSVLIKNISAKRISFDKFWKKKPVRLYFYSIVIKLTASTNSKRNLLSYVQILNRWFTQDSTGNTDIDLQTAKLDYWELLLVYLVWKRFQCVEPLEDFKGGGNKEEVNLEPYIYWDVLLMLHRAESRLRSNCSRTLTSGQKFKRPTSPQT